MKNKKTTSPAAEIAAAVISNVIVAPTLGNEETIELTVPAKLWSERLRLQSEASAIKRQLEAVNQEMGIPDAESFSRPLRLIIRDGAGDIRGKGSVYHFSGAVIGPGWRMKLS